MLLFVIAAALGDDDPSGWRLFSPEEGYASGLDTKVKRSGNASGFVQSTSSGANGWAQLMQIIKGSAYKGKRVRLRGYLKTDGVTGRAGLFMRIEGDKGEVPLAWDNMQDRLIRGSHNWQRVAVVLDVPQETKRILFGALLTGQGKLWIDDISLDVVDATVPVTDIMHRWPHPDSPENLDFERSGPVLDPTPVQDLPVTPPA